MNRIGNWINNWRYRFTLLRHKDDHGNPVFWSKDNRVVDGLCELQVPLYQLDALARYRTLRGEARFYGSSLLRNLKRGYTCDDFLRLAELRDHEGKPILYGSSDFDVFAETATPIEDAFALAALRDSEGRTIFRDFGDIGRFFRNGGDVARAAELVEGVLDDDDATVFRTPRDITRFVKCGGTMKYARALMDMRDHEGKQIFDGFSIALLKKAGKSPQEIAKVVALKDGDGQTIFSKGRAIRRVMSEGWDPASLAPYLDITDFEGKTLFRDGRDLENFIVRNKGTVEEAMQYAVVRDGNSRGLYGYEVALLKRNDVAPADAEAFLRKGLNAHTDVYYARLGLGVDDVDFSNDGRPRAFLVMPTADPLDPAFGVGVFSNEDEFTFLKRIFEAYDAKIRSITTVAALRREFSRTPDLDLAIIAGHGLQKELALGKNRPKYGQIYTTEERKLMTTTPDIAGALAALKAGGVCFLNSCLNGEGGADAENLANHVAAERPDLTIIAATEVFNAGHITINQIYPLDLRITAVNTWEPCTFVVRPTV